MSTRNDEEAAAELTAALSAELPPDGERMRAALAARIVADGEAMIRMAHVSEGARDASPPATLQLARDGANAVGRTSASLPRAARRIDIWRWTGWMAAAAAVLLWIIGPAGRGANDANGANDSPVADGALAGGATAAASTTLAALREQLLRDDSTATPIRWTATSDSAAHGATGDVVWSDRLQRGVLRIAGLAPNDRARWQYQLWIFDKTRDERYPVDGGVFDMPRTGGDVLVPVAPRLPVGSALVFAITVERAGGVVVSTRERIALLAQRGS